MIEVAWGELAGQASEAILRPVNADMDPVTHAGRLVGQRAGPSVEERLRNTGEVPVGGAVLTPGGDLPASFIVHVVIQSRDEPVTPTGVERALLNGLRRLVEWEVEELCLPPLGTGAGNLDAEEVARVMIDVLRRHLAGQAFPKWVRIVVDDEYERTAFENVVARAAP